MSDDGNAGRAWSEVRLAVWHDPTYTHVPTHTPELDIRHEQCPELRIGAPVAPVAAGKAQRPLLSLRKKPIALGLCCDERTLRIGLGPIMVDPRLVAPAGGDFRLAGPRVRAVLCGICFARARAPHAAAGRAQHSLF